MADPASPVVLITGASSGLGRHLVAAWHARGARLALVARDIDKLTRTADELQIPSERLLLLPCDITDSDAVVAMVKQLTARWNHLDTLINCAGISDRGTLAQLTQEILEQAWQLNVVAPLRCIRECLPLLKESHGMIVNIGSLAGKVAAPYLGSYPLTKHALTAISQQLRLELQTDGVGVLHVCPGPIQRDDTGQRYAEKTAGLPEAANLPGGGAKIRGLDPSRLAERIIRSTLKREREIVIPAKARVLFAVGQLSAGWGDWLLQKFLSR